MDDIVEIYKQLLSGARNRFPPETWQPYKGGYDNFRRCFRFLVNEELKLEKKDFKNIQRIFFTKYKLRGALQQLYNDNIYDAICYALPDINLKPWELKQSPRDTWNTDTGKEAIRWLFNEELKWSKEDILTNVSSFNAILLKYNLSSVLKRCFSGVFEMMSFSFPEYHFKRDEFKFVMYFKDNLK